MPRARTGKELGWPLAQDRKLSANFNELEFGCRHCGRIPPSGIDKHMIRHLQKLRDATGSPLHVASGARCPYHNARVGGAKASFHMLGQAADLNSRALTPAELQREAKDPRAFGDHGVGTYRTFTHVDSGPKRRWRG